MGGPKREMRSFAVATVLGLIGEGRGVRAACKAAHVSVSTYYFWSARTERGTVPFYEKRRGRRARHDGENDASIEKLLRQLVMLRPEWAVTAMPIS
jgi:transposase